MCEILSWKKLKEAEMNSKHEMDPDESFSLIFSLLTPELSII